MLSFFLMRKIIPISKKEREGFETRFQFIDQASLALITCISCCSLPGPGIAGGTTMRSPETSFDEYKGDLLSDRVNYLQDRLAKGFGKDTPQAGQ